MPAIAHPFDCGWLAMYLLGHDLEPGERSGSESGRNGHISRVPPPRDDNPANPRPIVPCIQRIPTSTEENFKPRAEIHRFWIYRHPDIAQIAGAIARRDIHTPTERNGEVSKVPANADALFMGFPRGPIILGVTVAKLDAIVGVLANGLSPRPAALYLAKK